jgi:hypothetical protein
MADTYSKLLGLSETNAPSTASGKSQPAQTPNQKERKTSKLANQQTSKEGNKAMNQPTNAPDSPIRNSALSQDTSFLSTKEKTKYGTYLTDESIQKIRIRAAETNRADHQVLQEIVNQYFEKLAK